MAERWAAITGAAGGIGTAVCLQLAQQGLAVLMLDVQDGPLAASAERVAGAPR
jgi:NAD(P)-dependent dehydrogenase (short-subunit alcohol dehydrogenase family)